MSRDFVVNYRKIDRVRSASDRISLFLKHVLDIPLVDSKASALDAALEPVDTLLVVNSPLIFLQFPEELDALIRVSKHLIWVQNDYEIQIPGKPGSKAQFWVRKAFGDRPALATHWTTIPDNAQNSPNGRYINWNQLTYNPPEEFTPYSNREQTLFYHGSIRKGRTGDFAKYFNNAQFPLTISTPIKSSRVPDFKKDFSASTKIIPALESLHHIGRYTAALYIEDKKSHTMYCSPANRLYEYLSVGTAILVDKACRETFARAGLKGDGFYVESQADIARLLPMARDIARQQHEDWGKDYREELIKTVQYHWKEHKDIIQHAR